MNRVDPTEAKPTFGVEFSVHICCTQRKEPTASADTQQPQPAKDDTQQPQPAKIDFEKMIASDRQAAERPVVELGSSEGHKNSLGRSTQH